MLGSLVLFFGCATCPTQDIVIHGRMHRCGRPGALIVPDIRRDLPFDSQENIDLLMSRHNLVKTHIRALNGALDCYETQAGEEINE